MQTRRMGSGRRALPCDTKRFLCNTKDGPWTSCKQWLKRSVTMRFKYPLNVSCEQQSCRATFGCGASIWLCTSSFGFSDCFLFHSLFVLRRCVYAVAVCTMPRGLVSGAPFFFFHYFAVATSILPHIQALYPKACYFLKNPESMVFTHRTKNRGCAWV